jgi:hypothetical protein
VSRWSRLAAALAVLALSAAPLGLAAQPAAAQVIPVTPVTDGFDAPTMGLAVHGDFTEVGNGVLRCPVAGEGSFLLATPAACRAASRRDPLYALPLFQWGANNGYDMQLAGAGTTAFDASSATLTVPAGASVKYAQLDWGGNTGGYVGTSNRYCTSPLQQLLKQPASPPPAPAAAAPQDQAPTIAVDAGGATAVPLTAAHFASSESAQAPAGMYSDWADVTTALQPVVGGQASTITVGDVWAPTGYGCAAGWSLTVVYDFGAATAAYPDLRQVDVYTGHLRGTFGADDEIALPEPSVTPATAHIRMGVTAYDGDWNNATDSLQVDGTAVDDPCGANAWHSDFFSSCAEGALDPLAPTQPIPNNFSVDAKTVTPTATAGTAAPGDVDVRLRPGADVLLLQGLVVAEDIHPTFTAQVTHPASVHAGSDVTFTVSGTNTGDVPLTDLTVADTAATDCANRDIGTVAPGAAYTVSCTVTGVTQPQLSDTATVSAGWPDDDSGLRAQIPVPFTVPVTAPQLTVTQTITPTTLQAGYPVTAEVTVGNAGSAADGDLTGITVTEPALPGCLFGPVASIAPGAQAVLTCSANPTSGVDATATAKATDGNGAHLSASTAPVPVTVIHPTLTISVTADPTQVTPGGSTDFTVTVRNTGDVPLDVSVSNDNAPDCDFTATGLATQAVRSQKCTVTSAKTNGTLRDVASYTATPEQVPAAAARPVTGSATTAVTVGAGGSGSGATTPGSGSGSGSGSAGSGSGSGSGGGATLPGDGGSTGKSGSTTGAATGGSATPKTLAWTGVSVVAPAIGGLALLGGGGGLLLVSRLRRRSGR